MTFSFSKTEAILGQVKQHHQQVLNATMGLIITGYLRRVVAIS